MTYDNNDNKHTTNTFLASQTGKQGQVIGEIIHILPSVLIFWPQAAATSYFHCRINQLAISSGKHFAYKTNQRKNDQIKMTNYYSVI